MQPLLKFTFCFKITIKWNLTKSHATKQNQVNVNSCNKTTLKMNELQKIESVSWLII